MVVNNKKLALLVNTKKEDDIQYAVGLEKVYPSDEGFYFEVEGTKIFCKDDMSVLIEVARLNKEDGEYIVYRNSTERFFCIGHCWKGVEIILRRFYAPMSLNLYILKNFANSYGSEELKKIKDLL